MRTLFLLTTLLFIIPNMFGQKEYRLNSPDGKLEVTLDRKSTRLNSSHIL